MTNESEESEGGKIKDKDGDISEGGNCIPSEKKPARSETDLTEIKAVPVGGVDGEKMEVGSPAKTNCETAPSPSIRSIATHSSSSDFPRAVIESFPLSVDKPTDATSKETVEFKVIFNKKKYDLNLPVETDVGTLKAHLQPIINIPPAMMKVMIKGLAKDEMTLERLGVTKGSKIMVVGSSLNDVLQVSTHSKEKDEPSSSKESGENSTCKQKLHKKLLDKGKPEDAMPGIKGTKESLPPHPISGMLNKHGGKVRLTFKLEADQLWIGTKERTEKLPLSSIRNVISEPIESHDEYHIVALQLGPTEASRYWIYWVPAQYVESIKDAILGKWQYY